MNRVCHMTSAHPWSDVRILLKECTSLAKSGYEVHLVVEGIDREFEGVHIHGCGEKPVGRKARMGNFARKVYERAKALDCDIYHFHDPELLPYGIRLKKIGKKVIFDSHENVSEQIMSKYWIPGCLRWIISKTYKTYENYAIAMFDAVVTATPHIAESFHGRVGTVITVNNYAKLDDIEFQSRKFRERSRTICYAGGINSIRGEEIMVLAMNGLSDAKLILAGPRDEGGVPFLQDNVEYFGKFTRKQVNEIYSDSRAGLIIFKPEPNHINAQPNKMFEYMAAGLPVICSDFPLWREIIEGCKCGICVNPLNVDEVREACRTILSDDVFAQELGNNGRKAVEEKYSWEIEEKKLFELYEVLLDN